MATYDGSVCGTIRGSIGPLLFKYSKGKRIVQLCPKYKIRNRPIDRNGRLVFTLTIQLFKELKKELGEYWDHRGKTMTAMNLFSRENEAAVLDTFPDKKLAYGIDNWVDLSVLRITEGGKLTEPFEITELKYQGWDGTPEFPAYSVKVKWSPETTNGIGLADDAANVYLIYCKPVKSKVYKESFVINIFSAESVRVKGEAVIQIGDELEPEFVSAFVFFTRGKEYSPSQGVSFRNLPRLQKYLEKRQ